MLGMAAVRRMIILRLKTVILTNNRSSISLSTLTADMMLAPAGESTLTADMMLAAIGYSTLTADMMLAPTRYSTLTADRMLASTG